MNGFTHVIALAGDTSAVAFAPMLTVGTPNSPPIIVGMAFSRAVIRCTLTRTRFGRPVGPFGKVTSDGSTDGDSPIIRLACAAEIAFVTAGPDALRLSKSLNARAVAPARAPASAEFCACDRPVMNMPTSTASVIATMNDMNPRPTIT